MNMEYKYVKKLKNLNSIKEVEEKHEINIPQILREIIIKNNGGRPINNIFTFSLNKEKVIKSIISYNVQDKENIYMFCDIFEKGYIPFAITEFGDVICIKNTDKKIELYNHEIDRFEYICENIENFLKMLYK